MSALRSVPQAWGAISATATLVIAVWIAWLYVKDAREKRQLRRELLRQLRRRTPEDE